VAVTIAIVKETAAHEKRVAATPETVKKLTALGAKIVIERGAGVAASYVDKAYEDAGATLTSSASDAISGADVVLKVQASAEDVVATPAGKLLIGQFAPYQNLETIKAAAAKRVNAFSMELVPRITRAQAMDVLSSQSNLAGYKAVLDAAEQFNRAFPMMMTAAGTIAPAKVFVMGAGVAGLQAIATAKRLGAVVSATDVRPAAKEQVESLGGTFIAVQDEEFKSAETAGGYAKEMSAEYKEKQAKLIEETIAKQDIVITTALIPGRAAPRLVTKSMVESMKPGSIIIDLAVESGGNVELSKAGEVVDHNGVKVVGHYNVPSRLATDASALYAKNLFNLLGLLINKETGDLAINWDDEIIKGIALTNDGKVIHPNFADKA
jgi:NAD(P) transhydrogenase subunit alpha